MPINKPIEGNYTPVIKDIMYLSIALEKAWQQSVRAIDRSEEVKPERPMITQQNYEDTLAVARKRMAELKRLGPTGTDSPTSIKRRRSR